MKNKLYKILSLLFSVIFTAFAVITFLPTNISAAEEIKSTVNISEARKNQRGPGYNWENRTDVLTLDDVNINTDDPYGLRLPKNCTVILKGDNYIKAAKYGISCLGTVVFKGDGTLTVDAGEIGFYLISQDNTQKIRLLGGEYKISAGKYGVYSEYADFSFVGKSMDINITSEDGLATNGRIINLLGGEFSANAPVKSAHALTVDSININVTASSSALSSKNIYIENISLENYNGENSIDAKSTAKNSNKSIIFGDNVPAFIDYILLAALLLGIAAGVFVPALHKKKKNKELYKRLKEQGYTTE